MNSKLYSIIFIFFIIENFTVESSEGTYERYFAKKDCEESLKDLIRFCKRDDPEKMYARIELGKWNIVHSDLIHLLLLYS